MGAIISVITSKNPSYLSKTFELEDDGTLTKEVSGHLQIGDIVLREFETLSEFAEIIRGLGPKNACLYGVPKNRHAKIILSKERYAEKKDTKGYTTRTREHIEFPEGQQGVMMFDYDPPSEGAALSRSELRDILYDVIDDFSFGSVWWSSASSYIYREDNREELVGLRGQRLYVMVADASDIPRAGKVLQDRLWLCNYGRIDVSKAGTQLERTTFDGSVYQPERLDFNGGALCINAEQLRPSPQVHDGPLLNTREALPDLTKEEKKNVDRLKSEAREAVKAEAAKIRSVWLDDRVAAQLPPEDRKDEKKVAEARSVAEVAVEDAKLTGDYVLAVFVGSKRKDVSVRKVLEEPDKYHGCKTLDPIEPDYDGERVVGLLYLKQKTPRLHSFARGGRSFKLSYDGTEKSKLSSNDLDLVPPTDRYALVRGKYYDRDANEFLGDGQIYRLTKHWKMAWASEKGIKRAESRDHRFAWLADMLPQFEGLIFDPSRPDDREIENPPNEKVEGRYINLFERLPVPEYNGEDISPWLDHLPKLAPDESDARVLLEYMAFQVQKPGKKLNWAPVIIGPEGSGKDTFFKPLKRYFGNYCIDNLAHRDIVADHNEWLEQCLFAIVQESSGGRFFDKKDAAETLKTLITSPPENIRMKRKYVDARQVPNILNIAFFTNNADAMLIQSGSRRYFPIVGEWVLTDQVEADAYFGALHKWLDSGGWQEVIAYLSQLKLETVVGPGRAPAASRFNEVALESLGQEAMDIHAFVEGRDWVTIPEIKNHFIFTLDYCAPPTPQKIGRTLGDLGMFGKKRYDFVDNSGNRQNGVLYARNQTIADRAKSDIQGRKSLH